MKEKDINTLWLFTLRIGMYTGKENRDTISSFLHGYEIGRDDECHFIEKLSESIEEEYKIDCRATGWIGQIERLAEMLETDWVTVFKKQSLKILTDNFTESITIEFTNSIKKRINGKMLGVKNHFRRDWITDWFGIVNFEADWFNEIWSKKELQLLREIEKELMSFGKVREIKIQIEATEKLINLCEKMYEEMNKEENES